MFGEIADLLDKEVIVGVIVKNDYDLKILVDILDKYVKRYNSEFSKFEDTEVSITTLKFSKNRYNALVRSLHDYDYNLVRVSTELSMYKMVSI